MAGGLQVVRGSLSKKATPGQRLKEESYLDIWGKTVPCRASSTCKGPEVEGCLIP